MNAKKRRPSMIAIPVKRLTLALLLTLAPAALAADGAGAQPETVVQHVLDAHRKHAYEAFIADCDEKVRASLTPQMFEGMSNMLGPRLEAGYTKKFLTRLRQKGFSVYLWKLEFSDGKDDTVVRIALDGSNKIAGIFFQ
jgi:hypothetical protein